MLLIFHRSIVVYIPFEDVEMKRMSEQSHLFYRIFFDIDITSTFVSSWQPTSGLHPTTNISRNTKANFISPPVITIKNIYSWHGTHLKNRKILWSSWDNHYLIHHDHQQPDATTSAISITTNRRSTKAPFRRHWHQPLHPSNINESPTYLSRVRHPLSDTSRQVDITNTTLPTSLTATLTTETTTPELQSSATMTSPAPPTPILRNRPWHNGTHDDMWRTDHHMLRNGPWHVGSGSCMLRNRSCHVCSRGNMLRNRGWQAGEEELKSLIHSVHSNKISPITISKVVKIEHEVNCGI